MGDSGALQLVVIPVDLSPPSLAALSWAREYAQSRPSRLVVLHVDARDDPDVTDADLDALVGDCETTERHRLGGKPADEILEFAADKAADLIVIGTHGHAGLERMLLGSVAEKVVRYARCPVVCVKADRAA